MKSMEESSTIEAKYQLSPRESATSTDLLIYPQYPVVCVDPKDNAQRVDVWINRITKSQVIVKTFQKQQQKSHSENAKQQPSSIQRCSYSETFVPILDQYELKREGITYVQLVMEKGISLPKLCESRGKRCLDKFSASTLTKMIIQILECFQALADNSRIDINSLSLDDWIVLNDDCAENVQIKLSGHLLKKLDYLYHRECSEVTKETVQVKNILIQGKQQLDINLESDTRQQSSQLVSSQNQIRRHCDKIGMVIFCLIDEQLKQHILQTNNSGKKQIYDLTLDIDTLCDSCESVRRVNQLWKQHSGSNITSINTLLHRILEAENSKGINSGTLKDILVDLSLLKAKLFEQDSIDRLLCAFSYLVNQHDMKYEERQLLIEVDKYNSQTFNLQLLRQSNYHKKIFIVNKIEGCLTILEQLNKNPNLAIHYQMITKFLMGFCMFFGIGIEINQTNAFQMFQEASDLVYQNRSYAVAQNMVGYCYRNGLGAGRDLLQGVRYYKMSAAQGFIVASYNLGCCYHGGVGLEKDLTQAVKYFEFAAQQGHAEAQNNLGYFYQYGEGVKKDLTQAVKYYRMAAKQGNAEAYNSLGNCYDIGVGVEKDLEQAVKYFRMAADKGNAEAQNNLGYCYKNGDGVEKDVAEAVKYYRMAAEQEHLPGQYNLGFCYEHGKGVKKNYRQAYTWKKLSSSHDKQKNIMTLGDLNLNRSSSKKDVNMHVKYEKRRERG